MELVPSRVEAFYNFMTERENIRLRRKLGWPRSEWTNDEIFKTYSFTNVKREHDRTTQLLMNEFYRPWLKRTTSVYGSGWQSRPNDFDVSVLETLLLNCVLFRYFGCIETARVIGWTENWTQERRDQIQSYGDMDELRFTPAYIVPNCGRSEPKYEVVLDIVSGIAKKIDKIVCCDKWEKQCQILCSCYGCGSFMAKEILLDYILASEIKPRDWSAWTPVGPGGCRGAGRVLTGVKVKLRETEALMVIRELHAVRKEYWRDDFVELDLTDIQFQLCEWDKRSRVAEGRAPKRKFRPTIDDITQSQEIPQKRSPDMGLNVSHDCWTGSYGAFNRFRTAIASVAGIDLSLMDGYGGDVRWDSLPPDVIHVLLNHSDCDGEIATHHLTPLADRLEWLIPALQAYDVGRPAPVPTVDAVKQFISGLRLAAENHESVRFQ